MSVFSRFLISLVLLMPAAGVWADMNDEPRLFYIAADELEWRAGNSDHMLAWDIESWYGTTRDRLIARAEGEIDHGDTTEFETVLGYSRAVNTNWNINVGWHADWQWSHPRHWATLEWEGVAPGFIDTRFQLLAGNEGRFSARIKLETEWPLTRRWHLVPGLKADWYSDKDLRNDIGAGFAGYDASLRLKYLVTPRFMPYVGTQISRLVGDSAELARAAGLEPRVVRVLAGLSIWF
jgi:copper resistance protein B